MLINVYIDDNTAQRIQHIKDMTPQILGGIISSLAPFADKNRNLLVNRDTSLLNNKPCANDLREGRVTFLGYIYIDVF
jgi:hypothetical protein